ncbi:MAG: diaminopimelate epimerase, partial [Acidimicrobiales bacterium]
LDGRGAGARLYGMPHAPAPATEPSQPASPGGTLALSKHEAAGNDFLVLVGTGETAPPSSALVRAVCDRRRGVGADGLLVVRPWEGDADLDMVLYNADGSRAEMSGNGIRCLVHAAVMAGLARTGPVRVRTDAGVRLVEYSADGTLARASVDMGVVTLGDEVEPPVPGAHARRADVGNPHVVVLLAAATDESATTGLESLDLRTLAGKVTAMVGEPMNVEVVVPVGERALALRVFERGVGETAACGTGSCAAAAVAHELGLVDRVVTVESPGGALTVRLGEAPGTPAVLSGPVRHVADVVVWPGALELAGRA